MCVSYGTRSYVFNSLHKILFSRSLNDFIIILYKFKVVLTEKIIQMRTEVLQQVLKF